MKQEERVEVMIPKGYAVEDPNFFVSINGAAYLLPRGKRVMVPAAVAAEIHRSERAQQERDMRSASLQSGEL